MNACIRCGRKITDPRRRYFCSAECCAKFELEEPYGDQRDAVIAERSLPPLTLREIAKAAAAEGVTYGEYVRRHKL